MESNETVTVNVIALKSFSTGVVSMFKGEIREMDSDVAETMIDNGLVSEYVPDVPEVGTNDKDKYLHTNAETGDKEWSNVPSELPSVSGTDEGKVLTVNNSGAWVAANPSSGGGGLVVTDTEGTLDKTWKEINDNAFCIIVHATSTPFGGDSSHRQLVDEVKVKDNDYSVFAGESTYVTDSETGYPILQVE